MQTEKELLIQCVEHVMSWEEHMNRSYETKMTKGFLNMEMPEQIKTEHYSKLEKLLHKLTNGKDKNESI
tara:strand:- start:437 stop:643 length:207 start_codon:yes stop_codon:yes gene_type:complete